MASSFASSRELPAAIKTQFVNRASRFANRARSLPGAASIMVGSIIGILFASLSGAFGTTALPPLQRVAFWTLLIGVNALLYLGWFAWQVRAPADWKRATLIGAVLLTLPLPLEIAATYRLVTGRATDVAPETVFYGLGVAGALALLATALRLLWPRPASTAVAKKGELWRHGVRDPVVLAAIHAEDHYCRLHWLDGRTKLVLARFADLSDELANTDGLIVRRGVWIAARAVSSVERDGRRLLVTLASGAKIAASPTGRAAMKAANWH